MAEYRSEIQPGPMQTAVVDDDARVTERSGEGAVTSVQLDIVIPTPLHGDGNRKVRVSPIETTQTLEYAVSRSVISHYSASHGDSNSETLSDPRGSLAHDYYRAAAPEKKITLFALRLALLEKAASGLGTLAFVWATVVLLGGFALTLERADFWFVTIILLIEGTRIFSRSHELEWQHETTLSVATIRDDARRVSFTFYNGGTSILRRLCRCFLFKNITARSRNIEENYRSSAKRVSSVDHHAFLKRTWSTSKVQLVPYTGWLSISKNVSRSLFWLQLLSASTCVVLSLDRLARQDYGAVSGSDKKNRRSALNIFYGLSLAEALLFLLEKAYWQWKIIAGKLLAECVNGSIFGGLKMDFVTYSMELLQSSSGHGQLTGARVLSALANNDRFAEETLRAIGRMSDVVEKLIEMLNWKNHHEQEIRRAAAEIICKLVRKDRNCIRVAAIAGSMESIASLLYDGKQMENRSIGKKFQKQFLDEYNYSVFIMLGLRTLKNLARDQDNCAKIGSSKDLLTKIIGLTEINPNAPESEINTVNLALHLVRIMASSTGLTGKILRKEIREIVFSISNLRDILQYREISTHSLQILAIDTLRSLALDDEGRETIGSTGGVLHNLFSVYFMERNVNGHHQDETTMKLISKAGEALNLLALESKHNCRRMLGIKLRDPSKSESNLIVKLISVLEDPVQGMLAARILRNLCAHTETDYAELREVTAAAAKVVKLFLMEKQREHQEAALGLAAQIFKFMTRSDFDRVLEESSPAVTKRSLISELLEIFRRHPRPSKEVPSIRRFGIELLIAVMSIDRVAILNSLNMEMRTELKEALEGVLETTSEMESYSTFSGSVGLSRHRIPIHSLVDSALELLRD